MQRTCCAPLLCAAGVTEYPQRVLAGVVAKGGMSALLVVHKPVYRQALRMQASLKLAVRHCSTGHELS